MSVAVGLLLLGVFVAFATLMLLEKLSALLALPLMAFCFLLIATSADLFAPPQVTAGGTRMEVDEYGRRRTIATEARPSPSRFTAWQRMRLAELDALHARAEFFATSVRQAADVLADCTANQPDTCAVDLRRTVQQVHKREQSLMDETRARFANEAVWPRLATYPPHFAGQHESFEEEYAALAVAPLLRPVVTVLDQSGWPNNRAEVEQIITNVQQEAGAALAENPTPPAPNSAGFLFACAASYLYEHLRMMLQAGSSVLAGVIMATLFGGMFAVYLRNLKVAERMVYWTAEFAGEHPRMICLSIFLVTAVIFTSVGGLGTVIMLGAIILPILRSVGLGAVLSCGLFLMGIAMGGTLHPVSRRLWLDFYGIPASRLDGILWTMVSLYLLCGLTWILWGTRSSVLSNFCAVEIGESPSIERVPRRLLVAPLVPVALVYVGHIDEITSFSIALVYMYVCAPRRRGATRVFVRSLIEGAQLVIPPVLLMIGIGMLITSLRSAPVQGYLEPLIRAAVPQTRWGYILVFSIAAPLALYRGPLNIWGMGLAVSAILLATTSLPPPAILGAVLAAGALQSVCDPTNTANVWIAGFQGVTVNQILRATFPIVWLMAVVAIVIFGVQFVR